MSGDGKALHSLGTRVCQPEACGGVTWLSLSNGGSWKRHISVGRSEREDEGYARTQPAVEIVYSFRSLSAVILGLQVLHDILSGRFGPHTGPLPLFRTVSAYQRTHISSSGRPFV